MVRFLLFSIRLGCSFLFARMNRDMISVFNLYVQPFKYKHFRVSKRGQEPKKSDGAVFIDIRMHLEAKLLPDDRKQTLFFLMVRFENSIPQLEFIHFEVAIFFSFRSSARLTSNGRHEIRSNNIHSSRLTIFYFEEIRFHPYSTPTYYPSFSYSPIYVDNIFAFPILFLSNAEFIIMAEKIDLYF